VALCENESGGAERALLNRRISAGTPSFAYEKALFENSLERKKTEPD